MKVFLDLEETLIESWFERRLLRDNIEFIKSFLKENNIKEVFMFSLAIFTEKDIKEFDRDMKDWLERELDVKINTFSLEDAFDFIKKKNGLFGDFSDIFLFNAKMDFFREWLLSTEQKGDFVLFDDLAINSEFITDNLNIKFIKVGERK